MQGATRNVASLLWLSNCSSLLIEAKANPAKKKLFPEVMTKLTRHLLVSFLSNLLTGTLTDNSADIMRVCVCVIMTQTSGRTVPTVLIQA